MQGKDLIDTRKYFYQQRPCKNKNEVEKIIRIVVIQFRTVEGITIIFKIKHEYLMCRKSPSIVVLFRSRFLSQLVTTAVLRHRVCGV